MVSRVKNDEREQRLIKLPPALWEMLDEDADRCRRSATKHLEALLVSYFGLEDVNIFNINAVRAAMKAKPRTIPMGDVKTDEADDKRKIKGK